MILIITATGKTTHYAAHAKRQAADHCRRKPSGGSRHIEVTVTSRCETPLRSLRARGRRPRRLVKHI